MPPREAAAHRGEPVISSPENASARVRGHRRGAASRRGERLLPGRGDVRRGLPQLKGFCSQLEPVGVGGEPGTDLRLIADIAFTENRLPVRRTTGVHPLGAPGAAGDPATSSRVRPATNAATARIRNTACTDGDNRRASPTSSFTPGSTTRNTHRFGPITAFDISRI